MYLVKYFAKYCHQWVSTSSCVLDEKKKKILIFHEKKVAKFHIFAKLQICRIAISSQKIHAQTNVLLVVGPLPPRPQWYILLSFFSVNFYEENTFSLCGSTTQKKVWLPFIQYEDLPHIFCLCHPFHSCIPHRGEKCVVVDPLVKIV